MGESGDQRLYAEVSQEDVIALRLKLGQLLVRAKLITVEQMNDALQRQAGNGGRFGDQLVAAGHISQVALDAFIHKTPVEPANIEATGIDENELIGLLMKLIYTWRLESTKDMTDAIKLPSHVVVKLVRIATERKLLYARGLRPDNTNMIDRKSTRLNSSHLGISY